MMEDNSASAERYSSPKLLYKKYRRLESTLMCDFVAELSNQRLKKYVFGDWLVFHSLLSLKKKKSQAIDCFLMIVW